MSTGVPNARVCTNTRLPHGVSDCLEIRGRLRLLGPFSGSMVRSFSFQVAVCGTVLPLTLALIEHATTSIRRPCSSVPKIIPCSRRRSVFGRGKVSSTHRLPTTTLSAISKWASSNSSSRLVAQYPALVRPGHLALARRQVLVSSGYAPGFTAFKAMLLW